METNVFVLGIDSDFMLMEPFNKEYIFACTLFHYISSSEMTRDCMVVCYILHSSLRINIMSIIFRIMI